MNTVQKAWLVELPEIAKNKANPEQAVAMETYMRNKFPFLGIKSPQRTAIFNTFCQNNPLPEASDLQTIVEAYYGFPQREFQYLACSLAIKARKRISIDHLPLLEFMICTKSWWDTVDNVASNLVGFILKKYPEHMQEVNNSFIHSENMWLRRTALIFQLKFKDELNEKILFDNIIKCKDEEDFFIRKAIGWALRQYSKSRPERVRQFLLAHTLSPLSVKEAGKYL